MKSTAFALFAIVSLLAGLGAAQTKITTVEGITEYRLDNGLDVLLFPDKSKPTFTVNVTYLVGSRHEGYGETGMAHLLEHMLFKGTEKLNDIAKLLSAKGGQYNGSTYFDRTNYFETMPASDENLRWTLDLEADRMVNSRISKKDLDSEFSVVRSEFESGENSPARVLEERVMSTAYLWHGYGRSPIGSKSDIEKVPVDKLQAFYRNYYQPDNAVLVLAGNYDEAKAMDWIKQTLGAIPKPSRKLTPTYTEEPTQDGEREVILRRVGDMQIVEAAYHVPAGSHPDSSVLEVLEAILDESPSGRMYKALVTSKKASSVSGDIFQFHDPGLAIFRATLRKDGDLAEAEKIMLDVIDSIAKEPPSKEEVDRARNRLLKNIDLSLNNSENVGIVLSETASSGDWRLLFLDRDRIRKVTPEDVSRVAKTYLKASNRTIGRFIPEAKPDRAEIPATPDVAAMLKDYKGDATVEAGESFDPSPANIDARTVRATLPNGMKLVLLSKKNRGATVTAVLNLHYGDQQSLAGKAMAAQMAGAMLMRGTQKHTRQALTDELDKIKAQMGVSAQVNGGASLSINTVRAGFVGALRLAAETLREPTFPESEFEQIRQSSLGSMEAQRSEPRAIIPTALYRHMSPYAAGDPREFTSIDQSIEGLKKLTLAEVKNFYSNFYGGSNAELVVVGDFDVSEIQKLASEAFGNWKSSSPYKMLMRDVMKVAAANQTIQTPDKQNAVFMAGMTMGLNYSDPDYAALILANTLIGGSNQSHLWQRIREKDGLSYGVGSSITGGAKDDFGQFVVQAIANPKNVDKVEADFKDEMAKILNEGFPESEVASARKEFLEDSQVNRAQDRALAGTLARYEQFGWTMKRDAELEAKIQSLTPADIQAALKRHIDLSSVSYFKGGDFKAASGGGN
jgi:zinc protease